MDAPDGVETKINKSCWNRCEAPTPESGCSSMSLIARLDAELVELKQTCRNRESAKAGQSTTFLGKEITDYEMDAIV